MPAGLLWPIYLMGPVCRAHAPVVKGHMHNFLLTHVHYAKFMLHMALCPLPLSANSQSHKSYLIIREHIVLCSLEPQSLSDISSDTFREAVKYCRKTTMILYFHIQMCYFKYISFCLSNSVHCCQLQHCPLNDC